MIESVNFMNDVANFTSAGTSQLFVNTEEGLEKVEVENITVMESDFEHSDMGRLYTEFPEQFNKIQKIYFRNQNYYVCHFLKDDEVQVLKFDELGNHLQDNS